MFKLRIFSKNTSCAPLRNILFNRRILLRLGSTTPLISKYKYLEINTVEGIKISSNKIAMKKAFDKANICHSEWINSNNKTDIIKFFNIHKIIIAKYKYSSKGNNIYYIDNIESLNKLLKHININDFVFEKYYFYPLEYRVHIDANYGCFYVCKKVLKEDANIQWHRHADNSIFVLITDLTLLPEWFPRMVNDCKKVLKQMHLTIACFDILASNYGYQIIESNTAPSLGSYGITYYSNHLKKYYDSRL